MNCHCEERSDEAIQTFKDRLDCFAEPVIGSATSGRTRWLAMTSSSPTLLILIDILISYIARTKHIKIAYRQCREDRFHSTQAR